MVDVQKVAQRGREVNTHRNILLNQDVQLIEEDLANEKRGGLVKPYRLMGNEYQKSFLSEISEQESDERNENQSLSLDSRVPKSQIKLDKHSQRDSLLQPESPEIYFGSRRTSIGRGVPVNVDNEKTQTESVPQIQLTNDRITSNAGSPSILKEGSILKKTQ